MLLQYAGDAKPIFTTEAVMKSMEDIHEYVDIIEIGVPIYTNGIDCIPTYKNKYPDKLVLADLKTTAWGYAKMAWENGADIVSLACYAEDHEFEEAVKWAHANGKLVEADFVGVKNIAERMIQLDRMGVDILSFGPAIDIKEYTEGNPYENPTALILAKMVVKNAKLSVMGGISSQNVELLAKHKPDIIVAGKSIFQAENPHEEAKKIHEIMDRFDQ